MQSVVYRLIRQQLMQSALNRLGLWLHEGPPLSRVLEVQVTQVESRGPSSFEIA